LYGTASCTTGFGDIAARLFEASCTTGFGDIAARLFEKRDETLFSKKFKTFIPLLSLLWFIPFVAGVYLLKLDFSYYLLGIVVGFSIFGFVLVPLIPMLTYCRNCPIKNDCPWMRNVVNA
jgi:hypothetical protein